MKTYNVTFSEHWAIQVEVEAENEEEAKELAYDVEPWKRKCVDCEIMEVEEVVPLTPEKEEQSDLFWKEFLGK